MCAVTSLRPGSCGAASRAASPLAWSECLHRQVPDELGRFRVGQPIAGEEVQVAVHFERRRRRGICALAAFLQSSVQVRGDRREGALALVFTAVPGLRKAPVGGRRGNVIEAMCRLRHASGWLALEAEMPLVGGARRIRRNGAGRKRIHRYRSASTPGRQVFRLFQRSPCTNAQLLRSIARCIQLLAAGSLCLPVRVPVPQSAEFRPQESFLALACRLSPDE